MRRSRSSAPTVDFALTVDVALLTPPPVQPLITFESVIVGFTVALLPMIGRPGENPTNPLIFVQPPPAAPAGAATVMPTGIEQRQREQQSQSLAHAISSFAIGPHRVVGPNRIRCRRSSSVDYLKVNEPEPVMTSGAPGIVDATPLRATCRDAVPEESAPAY